MNKSDVHLRVCRPFTSSRLNSNDWDFQVFYQFVLYFVVKNNYFTDITILVYSSLSIALFIIK